MRRSVLSLGVWLLALPAQSAPEDHAELLARIRHLMADNLLRLPNYTCRETIERTAEEPGSKKFRLIDRLRLDVAYVGGKELYAWPGADKFEDRPIDQIVGSGAAIASGAFAMHARAVFTTNAPQFSFAGEQEHDGRKAVRFDFEVPRNRSRYAVQTGEEPVIVAYGGYVDADAETLQPLTLHVQGEGLPPELKLRGASETLQYGRHRIGESDFLLPVSSELSMVEDNGRDNRNVTRFESCREYAGESTIRFDVDTTAPDGPAASEPIELPTNLAFDAAFRDPIESSKVARGDSVNAVVLSDVKKSGHVIVPKGALLTGRITRVATYSARSMVYFGIGVRFQSIEFGGRQGRFSANVESAGVGRGYSVQRDPETGDSVIFVQSTVQRIIPGTLLMLRTR